MKKIIMSLVTISALAIVAVVATGAFFSDEEKSEGNTFQAGAVDLQVDYNSTYTKGGALIQGPKWALKDLTAGDKFFDVTDVKPGDKGEGTISLHVKDNPVWACANIIPTMNDDYSSTEPELKEVGETPNGDSIFDGELAQNMTFSIWADTCTTNGGVLGDNIYQQGCDVPLLTNEKGPLQPLTYGLATPQGNVFTGAVGEALDPLKDYYIGVEWSIPTTVGNIIQTDKYMADISFYVEQERNNASFVCPQVIAPNPTPGVKQLVLENETIVQDGPWTIINDNTSGLLTWAGDGPTFNYTLTAKGLANSTAYSLIYYADGWPGNNPGAFIGSGTTDGSGNLNFSGTPNLGVDLPKSPDGNLAVGAKIWLVRTLDYNSGALSTGPMTAWNPSQYLFEGNVYIKYNDTDN